jgi:hypothetical protein
MLEDADKALYLAKNTGKDRVETWDPEKKTNTDHTAAHF